MGGGDGKARPLARRGRSSPWVGDDPGVAVNAIVVRFLYRHERLERLVEGDVAVLVDGGRVRVERLRKELITLAELESAARKQGFAALADVERAVLEPGGTISFVGKARDIEARLDTISRQLAALGAAPPARS